MYIFLGTLAYIGIILFFADDFIRWCDRVSEEGKKELKRLFRTEGPIGVFFLTTLVGLPGVALAFMVSFVALLAWPIGVLVAILYFKLGREEEE